MPANMAVIDVGIAHPEIFGIDLRERGQACGAGVALFLEHQGDVFKRQAMLLLQVALRVLDAHAFVADTALTTIFEAVYGILMTPPALCSIPAIRLVGDRVWIDPARAQLRVASTAPELAAPVFGFT